MSASANLKAAYRRRLQQRQNLIIGGIAAVMLVLLIICIGIWEGVIPAPYDPGFSVAAEATDAAVVQPCPPAQAQTVEMASIPVNVYNGTETVGLAAEVAQTLTDAGLTVAATADWPRGSYDGDVMITASAAGITNAYSLKRAFNADDVVVSVDETIDASDPKVSVVLGAKYEQSILAADGIKALPAGEAIAAPAGCAAVTTVPAPSATAAQ